MTDPEAAQDHERRSRDIADTTRRFLVAMNTGGVGVTFALAGAMVPHGVAPGWAVPPVGVFSGGLLVTLLSLFLAKHRELRRRDAVRKGEPLPSFGRLKASYTWDIAAAVLFAVGALVGLYQLHGVSVPVSP